MYKKFLSYFRRIDKYQLSVILIAILAFAIRFYDFSGRWGIGGDSARDAIIGLEALRRHQLPLMGPFSSAGPFVTGGIYYWLTMASYMIFPFLISAPWVITGLVSVLSVVLLMYLGKLLIGKRFSIFLGILAMLSPQYVGIALELSNPSFVIIFSILTIIFFVKLWQKNKAIFSFLMGLSIGLAINMHYEAINLLIFIPAVFFIPQTSWRNKIIYFLFACFGVFVPSFPILFWDSHQNFANVRNILDYFLIGQYRIYVPNSWRLFLFKYFPQYWSIDVGNYLLSGLILSILSGIAFVVSIFRRKISSLMLTLVIIFFILIIMNKSYRGERSDNYMLYFSPFILIFTSYLIYQFFTFKNKVIKFFGLILLLVVIILDSISLCSLLIHKNILAWDNTIIKALYERYPNQKFSLYDYKHQAYEFSMSLSLLLEKENKLDINGVKIGVNCHGKDCPDKLHTVLMQPARIVDLSAVDPKKLNPAVGLWINVNPSSVYDNQVGWLNQYKLKSTFTFSFEKYIIGRKGKI